MVKLFIAVGAAVTTEEFDARLELASVFLEGDTPFSTYLCESMLRRISFRCWRFVGR
jgi:hypothetical protein